MDADRGVIHNRARARQIRDFSGMLFGKITPTDIDGLIEFKNKCYVLLEEKTGDAKMDRGQELAFERMCDDLAKVKPTILIIAKHNTTPSQDIDVANTLVVMVRWKNKWYISSKSRTVRDVTEKFLHKHGDFNAADERDEQMNRRPE